MTTAPAANPTPDARLVLTTLGAASLGVSPPHGAAVEPFGAGKPLGLVAYLAFSPGHRASRDHLLDLLWADLEPDAARHALRQTLWFLHQRLGARVISGRDGELTLALPVESDREAFLEAIEQLEFERAIELYRGDFLPGFAAPGGADFEHWADLERDRLRLMFRRSAEALVRDRLSQGRLRKARQLAARLRDMEPEDERAWRLVLETLLAADDRAAAELEAGSLQRLLADEGRPPEPATRALLDLVRQPAPNAEKGARHPGLSTELIGREREFSVIVAAWEIARRGSGRHLHVAGAPGLGKTRLLGDIHVRLRAGGARAVFVRASPGDAPIPYALASEVAAALARLPGAAAISPGAAAALVALHPGLTAQYSVAADQAGDAEALRRRGIALDELLKSVADEQPVALLIDDLHWADPVSRQLLGGVFGKVSSRRVLAVTSARALPETIPPTATEVLVLSPLVATEIGALLASAGALPPAPWAEQLPLQLERASHGSPLLILQSLRLALDQGWLALRDGEWQCADPGALASELTRGAPMRRRVAELSADERRLLVQLSVAGTPLRLAALASIAQRDESALRAELLALEVRGLVTREADEWLPAHDEIGTAAIEMADPEALRGAHQDLGRTLAERTADYAQLRRAGHHLCRGGGRPLDDVFARWIVAARRQGDRRSLDALAADLVGTPTDAAMIRRLVTKVPLRLRLGLTSTRRTAMAWGVAAAVVVTGGSLLFASSRDAPDAALVAISRLADGSVAARSVLIHRAGWERRTSIPLMQLGRAVPMLDGITTEYSQPDPNPDGSAWTYVRVVTDSGGRELFLRTTGHADRRLTNSRHDDAAPSWSPDGERIVFTTDRWNRNSWSDLAILDPATGAVRQLTRGDDADNSPHWSPEGTRIAFGRRLSPAAQAAPENRLCWITVDGLKERCLHSPAISDVVGWYDGNEVLVRVYDAARRPVLARVNLESGEMQIVARGIDGPMSVSPDSRWVACFCTGPGSSARSWLVYPLDRPDLAVPVVADERHQAVTLVWTPIFRKGEPIDRVEIVAPGDSIPVGVPLALHVRGLDRAGRPIPVPVVLWQSSDTAVATIDRERGIVLARRGGRVTVHASAGGWREDSVVLRVSVARSRIVFRENWERGINPAWIPFGEPLPSVAAMRSGQPAFGNGGDGSFSSGAYSRREFHSLQGVGVEADISTPITALQDQILEFKLSSWTDSSVVTRWDHRTGGLPARTGCSLTYPSADGVAASRTVTFDGQVVRVDRTIPSGRTYTLRLQIFPDGRCGVALNGTPIGVSESRSPPEEPHRIVLQGKSVGTKILVGRLEVWEGVRVDVDWSRPR